MQVSKLNIVATNSQMRKLKFKDNQPAHFLNSSNGNIDYPISLKPIFGFQCNRLDKVTRYQKMIMNKLSNLTSLSQTKYSGSPNQRKNSSIKDKIRQRIIAVIDGKDLFKPQSRTLPEYTLNPQTHVRADSRASQRQRQIRPTTTELSPKRKKKTQNSILLQPCQVSTKPLQSRPPKFFPLTISQSEKVTQSHHNSTLLNLDKVKESLRSHKHGARYQKSSYSPTKTRISIFHRSQVLKPVSMLSEDIKPWDSTQFESAGFLQQN